MGDRLATIDMSRKMGVAVPPFPVAWVEAYLRASDIHPVVWPQYINVTDRTGQRSDSVGRTVLQTVAQKPVTRP